jgi:hypothetical protein
LSTSERAAQAPERDLQLRRPRSGAR